jgi:hypothetical protein
MNINLQSYKDTCPSIFATNAKPTVSNKYSFVPTIDIVGNFEREGWLPSSVRQMGKSKYGLHEIRFSNGQLPMVGDSMVQAIVRNSHDGSTNLSVSAGLFRLVCSNGLTVPTSISESFRVRHSGVDVDTVREITDKFAKKLPMIERSVNKMREIEMTDAQVVDFAQKSQIIRFEDKIELSNLTIEDLIKPVREEDGKRTLWNVFNTVQEKFVRGGIVYRTNKGGTMVSRRLNNIMKVNKLNTELWELAETYC